VPDRDDLRRRIGERARVARDALGLTQASVAAEVGIATEVYGRLERGLIFPSVPTLVRLAQVLRVPPGALLEGEAQPTVRPDVDRIVALLDRASPALTKQVYAVAGALLRPSVAAEPREPFATRPTQAGARAAKAKAKVKPRQSLRK
jgi:transcriptional regulator with XRE-family HTH domain